jgi:hypothetical protein
MSGVSDGLDKVAVSGDASAVFRRTRELSVDADWVAEIGKEWKHLLQDDGVFPVILGSRMNRDDRT